jgi:hypothetical protein
VSSAGKTSNHLKPLKDSLSLSIGTVATTAVVVVVVVDDGERLVFVEGIDVVVKVVVDVRVVVLVTGIVMVVVVEVVVVVVEVVDAGSFSIATRSTSLISIKICNAITHATINQIQDSFMNRVTTNKTHKVPD